MGSMSKTDALSLFQSNIRNGFLWRNLLHIIQFFVSLAYVIYLKKASRIVHTRI